jgi:hypothetical protein
MSSKIYCLHCKVPTDTLDEVEGITKNNRRILKGKCAVCNAKKNKFIKSDIKLDNINNAI